MSGVLDNLLNARFYAVDGVQQTRRQTINFIGVEVVHDATTDTMSLNFTGNLPATPSAYQHLEYNGTAWVPVDSLTLPVTGSVHMATPATGAGADLLLAAGDGGLALPGGVGGNAILRAGNASGDNVAGEVQVRGSFGNVQLRANNYGIAFNGLAPVARPSINAVADSSGGAAGYQLNAVSGSGADAAINNDLATLCGWIQRLHTALVHNGLISTTPV